MSSTKETYEDAYARKFDKYLTNCLIKMGKKMFFKFLNVTI